MLVNLNLFFMLEVLFIISLFRHLMLCTYCQWPHPRYRQIWSVDRTNSIGILFPLTSIKEYKRWVWNIWTGSDYNPLMIILLNPIHCLSQLCKNILQKYKSLLPPAITSEIGHPLEPRSMCARNQFRAHQYIIRWSYSPQSLSKNTVRIFVYASLFVLLSRNFRVGSSRPLLTPCTVHDIFGEKSRKWLFVSLAAPRSFPIPHPVVDIEIGPRPGARAPFVGVDWVARNNTTNIDKNPKTE